MSQEHFYEQLGRAIGLAATLFKYKVDKQGRPYILHCLKVMRQCSDDPEVQVIGILHDVVEDIPDWTIQRLYEELGLTNRQCIALQLLTHHPEVPYEDYIRNLSHNKDAVAVKRADLRHNTDILRIKGLRKKDFERLEKYHKAFVYLSE